MSHLSIQDVSKRFGATTALSSVSIEVATGELAAVLGPSGCGKTTLLRCIAGFEHPDTGRIRVNGAPVDHLPPESRRIAVVPQEGALFPHLSVRRNVGYGLDGAQRQGGRVDEVLELVDLSGYGHRMPHQLSGGEQQRVALARALAPRPALILLDEPFSALDASLRGELRGDVRAALHADQATAVLVTHDQNEALSIADQVIVLRDGTVLQADTPQRVYRQPADPWVAGFVGDAVLIPAMVTEGQADTVIGALPVAGPARDGAATVLIRPEQLRLLAADPAAVPGEVTAVDYFGHDALVSISLSDGTPVIARVAGEIPPTGEHVGVRVHGQVQVYHRSGIQ